MAGSGAVFGSLGGIEHVPPTARAPRVLVAWLLVPRCLHHLELIAAGAAAHLARSGRVGRLSGSDTAALGTRDLPLGCVHPAHGLRWTPEPAAPDGGPGRAVPQRHAALVVLLLAVLGCVHPAHGLRWTPEPAAPDGGPGRAVPQHHAALVVLCSSSSALELVVAGCIVPLALRWHRRIVARRLRDSDRGTRGWCNGCCKRRALGRRVGLGLAWVCDSCAGPNLRSCTRAAPANPRAAIGGTRIDATERRRPGRRVPLPALVALHQAERDPAGRDRRAAHDQGALRPSSSARAAAARRPS